MEAKKVLIIDDEFPMRYLIEYELKRNGYAVSLAKDGPDGVKAAQMHRPDLIVLDVMMPGMNGFEVCQQIRSDPDIARIPIIFLTASEAKEYKTRAFDVGADDYLTKPFQAEELLAHITAVLRRSRLAQSGPITTPRGRIVSLFSPKGGVGTTTLAVQLGEAMAIQESVPVVMMDLDLPLGGLAPTLCLSSQYHILHLLNTPPANLSLSLVKQYAQRQRANLLVVPAPGKLTYIDTQPLSNRLSPILELLVSEGYQIILDLGSRLTPLTEAALKASDMIFVITSGQPVANKLHDEFIHVADRLGIEARRLMPVVNELHGSVKGVQLARVPVARIPHASERSRTRLWLREQGMRKLVAIMR